MSSRILGAPMAAAEPQLARRSFSDASAWEMLHWSNPKVNAAKMAPDAHARIDDAVIEEACRWNTDSAAPHAHWIHLRSQPYSSGRELLVNLARVLPTRGFVALILDA